MFGNFQRRQSCCFELWVAIDCNMPLDYGTDRSFFLDDRIISINAAVFEMSIIHRETVLEWAKGQIRTSALREP